VVALSVLNAVLARLKMKPAFTDLTNTVGDTAQYEEDNNEN